MELIISIAVFVTTILIACAVFLVIREKQRGSGRIRKQLRELTGESGKDLPVDILRKRRSQSSIPWLDRLFRSIPFLQRIDRLLLQSNLQYPLGVFIMASFVMAFVGYFAVSQLLNIHLLSLLAAGFLGMTPFFYMSLKKKQRMQKFERQFPDALDLIARSLKAGHSLSGGLQMVGQEFEDPIKTEFSRMHDEINFGIGIREALMNLTRRVDCKNLSYFAVALSIQRETGGDLCEILEKISRLTRERFKLQGRIRALSAEGKLSGIVLIAIPLLVAFALSIINPDYIKVLISDPLGKRLITGAIVMLVIGVIAIRKLVAIKV
ncbi:MAG: type II secretion system F family protein [Candidatus Loosdrechtia sp.]|uniref:type II secretion system F family protein n=1 Tax=Candidatus Loosdrechtia sp. TaxID=3101272 RepID=UPI003A6560E5|nr:MAG: type II secretion system F family protein [Candidatus Jettenia sp. AMX2]